MPKVAIKQYRIKNTSAATLTVVSGHATQSVGCGANHASWSIFADNDGNLYLIETLMSASDIGRTRPSGGEWDKEHLEAFDKCDRTGAELINKVRQELIKALGLEPI